MPRITHEQSEYSPKPTGLLEAKIVELGWLPKGSSDIPKMKHLIDPKNEGVMRFELLPEGHDRIQNVYVPIRIVMKDGEVDVKESKGITKINKLMEGLGFDTAGFSYNGNFVDEQDDMIQMGEDVANYIAQAVIDQPDFRVLIHIYKERTKEGKHYFRSGLNFFQLSEAKYAQKAAEEDLKYQAEREASQGIADPPEKPQDEEDAPKIKRPFSKRL